MSFFRKLAKDTTANTLAISAASLLPLLAMVGGGVDASRYYMAEARLQAACDAGALAARSAMSSNGFTEVVDGTNRTPNQIADAFFNENFSDGLFGITSLEHNYTSTDDDEIQGSASGVLPTSIMAAFGFDNITLSVNCQSDINIANTDIVLVLDTTGSMAGEPIENLRDATVAFYDTVSEATATSAQVRYGIIPYSQQVNVGALLQPEWMKANHTYQARETIRTFDGEPETSSIDVVRTGEASNFTPIPGFEIFREVLPTYEDCVDEAISPSNNNSYLSHNTNDLTLVSQSGTNPRISVFEGPASFLSLTMLGGEWLGLETDTNRECFLVFRQESFLADATITIVEEASYTWDWEYKPISYDVSGVTSTNGLVAPTGEDMADETHLWNGCIEEADSVNTPTWDPVPAGAFDLDIDLVPSNNAERWAPMLPTLARPRYRDRLFFFQQSQQVNWILENQRSLESKRPFFTVCPRPARQLNELTDRTELVSFLSEEEGFFANGATFHDIGMVWAGRMISPDGIFASRNATAPNGDGISRHVVFMTDGEIFPNLRSYSPYGMEWWDRRVTTNGDQATSTAIHAARFQAACRAVRNKNITVWVVAFGVELTQNLVDCATPGRAYSAADGEELDTAFRDIGESIADLRLTQ